MKKALSVMLFSTLLLGIILVGGAGIEVSANNMLIDPVIVDTLYPTEDVVIADIVLNGTNYGVDNTGVQDSTQAIQSAINDCASAGGGTVFLPVGKYRLTGPIYIHPFVTLRGDYQNPDEGNEYGTIIIADVPSSNESLPALFTVGGSAGAVGLTIFYPQQSIDNVRPYPYTFYVTGQADSYMLQSIVNCTLINSYKGIGVCVEENNAHEMLTLENLKGTVLKTGIEVYNQADVGTAKNVSLSNSYWVNAGSLFNAPSLEEIEAYTMENTTGFILGDLEWMQFVNINISNYKNGIKIVKGIRASFAGAFYNLTISDCEYGIDITRDSLDERWGMVIANSEIQGSAYSMRNLTKGAVKMSGVQLKGKTFGMNIFNSSSKIDDYQINYSVSEQKPTNILYVFSGDKTGHTDESQKLQAMLNIAGQTGGTVYMPAGCYRLDAPVNIPSGVELRGSSSVATRDQSGNSKGTLLLSYYGYDVEDSKSAQALITLAGENAGINGIRIVFALNNPAISGDQGIVRTKSYAIKGTAKGVYVKNVCAIAASGAVLMENSDDFFIKKLVGLCFENFISISNSNGGHIESCLQNANSMSRNGFASMGIPELNGWITEDKLFTHIFNPITRQRNETLQLKISDNTTVLNLFAYGTKTLLDMKTSDDFLLVNIGADNIGDNAPMLKAQKGSMTAINILRYNGYSYENDETILRLYNRISIDEKLSEWNVVMNTGTIEGFMSRILEFFANIYASLNSLFNSIF